MQSLWSTIRKKSNVARKSVAFANQIPRAIVRTRATPEDYRRRPPLLANSFPKSGTHLLMQILEALPGNRYFGSFIASTPSITFREHSAAAHLNRINRLVPGELAGAHIFYDPAYAETLARLNVAHFFVYRDPRDVAVSEAHYLAHMNRWHRMHRYFARLETDAERISASILGMSPTECPYDFQDIGKRFARYRGWLDRNDVCALRYEDLIAADRADTLNRVASFYADHTQGGHHDRAALIASIEANIQPQKSHTFRSGRAGGWQKAFKPEHKEQMKAVAGTLLVELGYENDLDW